MTRFISLFASLALAAAAHAGVILQDTFDNLTPGELNGQNTWTAVSGVTVATGGLSYSSGDITISGGSNHVESSLTSTAVTAPLATHTFASQSADVWFSFTLKVDSPTNNSRYWFWVSDTTSINTGITGAIADTNTSNKRLYSEIRFNSASTPTQTQDIVDGTTYFVVGRLSKDGTATNTDAYDRMEFWLNPSSTTLGVALTSDASNTSSIVGGITNFGLTTLDTAPNLVWDNLIVGTSKADVLDVYSTSAIPEPSSAAALGGLGVLAAALLRRRHR